MKTGKITTDGDTGHSLECSMAHAYEVFWDNKNEVFDLVKSCWNVPDDIFNLQKQFVYDPDVEYPYAVKTSVDIDTGESGQIKYNMINNRSESDRYNMWAIKRQDLTKIPWKRL